jgi:hypothetical protein
LSEKRVKVCRKKISDDKNKKRNTSNGSSEDSSRDFSGRRGRFPCCICKAKDHKTHKSNVLECQKFINSLHRLGMALKASNVVGNPVTLHLIW